MANNDKHYAGTVADAADLSHPEHRALFDHWKANRRGEDVPLRSSFDPLQFHRSMPRMAIIERSGPPDASVFRYRLAGTEIARRAGRDPTGKSFEELYEGNYLETANRTYREISESGQAHFSQRVFTIGGESGNLRYDRLILPYSSNGSSVDQFVLLIVVVEQDAPVKQVGSFSIFGRKRNK
ncbi:PAS domain-containing protein [Nisaea sediminum]|uniref:PAS domain-containing protein n=1 Tax=Nisaea sediminum TaxID=2775867 RepID=UPI0018677FC3|nr:PAS domain-containing protein [Nisaea sediminum]